MNEAEPRRPYLTNVKHLSFAKNVIGNRHPQHPFCCTRFGFERAGIFFRAHYVILINVTETQFDACPQRSRLTASRTVTLNKSNVAPY